MAAALVGAGCNLLATTARQGSRKVTGSRSPVTRTTLGGRGAECRWLGFIRIQAFPSPLRHTSTNRARAALLPAFNPHFDMSSADEQFPDVIPWFDNEADDEYSEDPEDGYPYDE